MNKNKSIVIIIIAAVAGIAVGFTTSRALQSTTRLPEGEVHKVPYAERIMLHMHPEKFLPFLPSLTDHQVAYLYGMNVNDYKLQKKRYRDQAGQKADELLRDPSFARKIDQLPFTREQTVLVLGESTADALNSWVYILQDLLEKRRPEDNIRIRNAAISGQTTTEALRKITMLAKTKPDWVLCHLGANDCMRYGGENKKTSVSISETLKNLDSIREILETETNAKILWIAPAPIHEEKVSSFPPFQNMKMLLKNADILATADSLSANFGPVLDLRDEFGVPARPGYVQFDGGHLTIEGQAVLAVGVVNALSGR